MLDAKEKDQLEKANANSASALSKVAELEKGVAQLRSEMESNNQEIQKSLTNLLALVERLVNPNEPGTKVSRTAVSSFTLRKEDDSAAAGKTEVQKSVHELLKESLQNPQRASNYLR